ncbi:MAG: tRNA 2-thiouridine(34) synthase MnmA [Dysosmobacter sp.]
MSFKRVFAAMSGGVDSAAAALLLRRAGYDVTGVTLRLHAYKDRPGLCGSADDIETAKAVSAAMGIPHQVLDSERAVLHRRHGPLCGGICTRQDPQPLYRLQPGDQVRRSAGLGAGAGADAIATGHYARVRYDEERGRWLLLRGRDRRKDQSYVLYQLTQHQLSHLLLPVGDYEKPDIRALAAEAGLENAEKADSQDICFVPDGDYVGFLQRYGGVTPVPGDFVDQEGHVLGRHRGLECYTTGQRKGLGVSADAPLYVVRKDLDAGTVVLGPDSALYTDTLTAERVNLIPLPALTGPIQVTAKTRYSQKEAEATVEPLEGGRVRVTFAQPQRAVTAGQAVAFYDGEAVVGGGTICGR